MKRIDHSSDESWIYSYGDMITLLLMFFILLYSLSQQNQTKNLEKILKTETKKEEAPAEIGKVSLEQLKKIADDAGVDPNIQILASISFLLKNVDEKDLLKQKEYQAALQSLGKKVTDIKRILSIEGTYQTNKETQEIIFSRKNFFNGNQISTKGDQILKKIVTDMRKISPLPELKVEAYNSLDQSIKEATRICDSLLKLGIPLKNISCSGYGEVPSKAYEKQIVFKIIGEK
jgi:flagellar motor protein MotB